MKKNKIVYPMMLTCTKCNYEDKIQNFEFHFSEQECETCGSHGTKECECPKCHNRIDLGSW